MGTDPGDGSQRIHFASAMTLLGHSDGDDHLTGASYLELVEFLTREGAQVAMDLEELWRRIVFSIAIRNTDDHLRNHGFLLTDGGWVLSPAYDLNPTPDDTGLSLNISETDNATSFDLALVAAPYFRLRAPSAEAILHQVKAAVGDWKELANALGIPRTEQEIMAPAFGGGILSGFAPCTHFLDPFFAAAAITRKPDPTMARVLLEEQLGGESFGNHRSHQYGMVH